MKIETILGGTLIAFHVGVAVLDIVAAKHAKKRAKVKAIEVRTAEQAEAFKEAEQRCDIFKVMSSREKKEQESMLKSWKIAKEYDIRKDQILMSVDEGLDEFKTQLGYFDKIEELDEEFDAGLEAFKKAIDYDSSKEKFEEAIKEAEKIFEKQKEAFNAASDDISDTTMKLRHAAEESMTSKIKESKEKIAALDKQVEEETDKLRKIKIEKSKALEEKVSKEKIRLEKKQESELNKLNKELDNAKLDIQRQIKKNRTTEETAAASCHEDDVRLIQEQKKIDEEVARDIFVSTPREEDLAQYLKSKKVPRWVVGTVSVIPLAVVEFICYRYVRLVVNVIKRMA